MRPTTRIFALGLLATSALAGLPRDVAATNGMNPICYGTDNCGMGGAGIALGGNAAGAILNPALSGRAGREILVSAGWLHANVTGQVKGGGPVAAAGGAVVANNQSSPQDSDATDFPDGTLAINWKFNDQWSANFAAFPGGGGATDWKQARTAANFSGNGSHDTQIRTRYFFFEPSISYTPPADRNWTFGVGVIVSYQDMKTNSLGKSFGQLAAADKQVTDSSMGLGFHLGVFWQPDPILSFGATYRSRVWSESYEHYRSKNGGKQIFQGPMDMPEQWGVGMAVKPPPVPKLTLAGDLKYIAWQNVTGIGGKEPADGGFGWKSQFVFAAGAAYDFTDKFTGRFGYNYGKSPVDAEHMFANFLFPAISEHHITAGASYKLTPAWELGASAFWSPENTVVNNAGANETYAQAGGNTFVSMEQYGAQISAKLKF